MLPAAEVRARKNMARSSCTLTLLMAANVCVVLFPNPISNKTRPTPASIPCTNTKADETRASTSQKTLSDAPHEETYRIVKKRK